MPVTPIPGASAIIAALSASGLPTDRFVFEGFMPAKQGERESRLAALRDESRTIVFYEAPHRLKNSLEALRRILGNRDIAIARELSKVHEEFLRGTIDEITAGLAAREIKGEITVIVRAGRQSESMSQEDLSAEIRRLSAEGISVREISVQLAKRYRLGRREVYQLALRLKRASEST
jgi:16S rRNA (cytidine1402-2'-O)-methyltransferase